MELFWAEKYKKYEKGPKIPIKKSDLSFQVLETIDKNETEKDHDAQGASSSLKNEYLKNHSKDQKNILVWGDNKPVISSLIRQGWSKKINLIYIDPPFFTGSDFEIRTRLSGENIKNELPVIKERAYKDTWGGGISSYIDYMYERLVLMKKLLAEDGSIYVHLDWHIGHYIKVVMDEIFGADNLINEIVWFYKGGALTGVKKNFPRKHDIILLYSKSGDYTFNQIKYDEISEQMIKRWGQYFDEENKIRFGQIKKEKETYKRLVKKFIKKNGRNPGDEDIAWEIEGSLVRDVWEDIPEIRQSERYVESIGYVTQKPEALLKRIILASSNPGDIVADFFCGSGTTLAVSEKLKRRWIGSDLSKFAIQVTKKRLLCIQKSKDLIGKNKYSRLVRPFDLWKINDFETVYFQENREECLMLILKLYQSQAVSGLKYLHGKKENVYVHVGSLDSPVTIKEVKNVVSECESNNVDKADILGFKWNLEVDDLSNKFATENRVNLRFVQIPSFNEIKSVLFGFDLLLFKDDERGFRRLSPNVKFAEVSNLQMEIEANGNEVTLKIVDFQMPQTEELKEIASEVEDFRKLIDYFAIDWDYKGDIFRNKWHSFREKGTSKVDYEAKHMYGVAGDYKIMVNVVDVFGRDLNKVLEVKLS